jgi:Tfp pilus assembly protein PilV
MHSVSNKQNAKREGGFTLLETAVALVVMMIGGLGIAAVFAYAIKNNTGARDRAAAIAVAQQEVERLRNLRFNDAALTATGTPVPATVQSAGRSYTLSTRITDTTATVKTIQVTVTPQNSSDPWALSSVSVYAQRSAFSVGPYLAFP